MYPVRQEARSKVDTKTFHLGHFLNKGDKEKMNEKNGKSGLEPLKMIIRRD